MEGCNGNAELDMPAVVKEDVGHGVEVRDGYRKTDDEKDGKGCA